MHCPRCNCHLNSGYQKDRPNVLFWFCRRCLGRLVEGSKIQHFLPESIRGRIDEIKREGKKTIQTRCPRCGHYMNQDKVKLVPNAVAIDACSGCSALWFDGGEIEALSQGRLPPTPAKEPPSKDSGEVSWEFTTDGLAYFQDIADVPLLEGRLTPGTATMLLVFAILAVSVYGFHVRSEWIEKFGFYSARAFQNHFSSWVMSAFVHVGWIHLIGNMYFLFLFGNEVEAEIGPAKFLWVFFASVAGGNLAAAIAGGSGTFATVGASGGITGVMAVFALFFPGRRISFSVFRLFDWSEVFRVFIPAWAVFTFYVATDIAGLARAIEGYRESISYISHIGGAIVGVLSYLVLKR